MAAGAYRVQSPLQHQEPLVDLYFGACNAGLRDDFHDCLEYILYCRPPPPGVIKRPKAHVIRDLHLNPKVYNDIFMILPRKEDSAKLLAEHIPEMVKQPHEAWVAYSHAPNPQLPIRYRRTARYLLNELENDNASEQPGYRGIIQSYQEAMQIDKELHTLSKAKEPSNCQYPQGDTVWERAKVGQLVDAMLDCSVVQAALDAKRGARPGRGKPVSLGIKAAEAIPHLVAEVFAWKLLRACRDAQDGYPNLPLWKKRSKARDWSYEDKFETFDDRFRALVKALRESKDTVKNLTSSSWIRRLAAGPRNELDRKVGNKKANDDRNAQVVHGMQRIRDMSNVELEEEAGGDSEKREHLLRLRERARNPGRRRSSFRVDEDEDDYEDEEDEKYEDRGAYGEGNDGDDPDDDDYKGGRARRRIQSQGSQRRVTRASSQGARDAAAYDSTQAPSSARKRRKTNDFAYGGLPPIRFNQPGDGLPTSPSTQFSPAPLMDIHPLPGQGGPLDPDLPLLQQSRIHPQQQYASFRQQSLLTYMPQPLKQEEEPYGVSLHFQPQQTYASPTQFALQQPHILPTRVSLPTRNTLSQTQGAPSFFPDVTLAGEQTAGAQPPSPFTGKTEPSF